MKTNSRLLSLALAFGGVACAEDAAETEPSADVPLEDSGRSDPAADDDDDAEADDAPTDDDTEETPDAGEPDDTDDDDGVPDAAPGASVDAGAEELDSGANIDAGPSGTADAGQAPAIDAAADAGRAHLVVTELALFEPPSGAAQGFVVEGDRVYLAATSAGVVVVDVSDPALPVTLGQYDFPPGQLAYRVAIDGDRIAVGLRGTGWALLDASDVANIELLASDDSVGAVDVALEGDTLYTLNGTGVSSIDVSDPANPMPLVTDLVLPGSDNALVLSGSWLYASQAGAGFSIVDVSDPANLVEASSADVGLGANHLALSRSTLFVAHADGVAAFDVTQAEAPAPLGTFSRERAHSVAVYDERLLVFGDDTTTTSVPFITVVDASDPMALAFESDAHDGYSGPLFVRVAGDLLLASVDDDDALHLFGLALE